MLAAAKPWTYWMAIPLLVSSVLALAVLAGVYLNKVVEPRIRREQALAAAEMAAAISAGEHGRELVRGRS
jgi:p-aminobenzoyl-glutamate transporter AbgT